MTTPTTIVLADGHLPTRGLLQMILEERDFAVVADVASADQAVEQVVQHRPTVCLLDVDMPEGGGLRAVAEITQQVPETACVMLSSSESDADLMAALRAGAVGFLSKDMDLDRLPDALGGVLRGEPAVPRSRMARVLQELRLHSGTPETPPGHRMVQLTEDEWQVVQDLRLRATEGSGDRQEELL